MFNEADIIGIFKNSETSLSSSCVGSGEEARSRGRNVDGKWKIKRTNKIPMEISESGKVLSFYELGMEKDYIPVHIIAFHYHNIIKIYQYYFVLDRY